MVHLMVEMWNCHLDTLVDLLGGRSARWWALTVKIWNCHSDPLADLQEGRSATSSANIRSNSRNVKSPFFTTRFHYQGEGVDLPLHLPIWALTVEISNCHSWPLDATMGASRSASWSANMTSNSKNLKLPFRSIGRSTRELDLPVDLPNMSSRPFYCAHHRGLFASRKTN